MVIGYEHQKFTKARPNSRLTDFHKSRTAMPDYK